MRIIGKKGRIESEGIGENSIFKLELNKREGKWM